MLTHFGFSVRFIKAGTMATGFQAYGIFVFILLLFIKINN